MSAKEERKSMARKRPRKSALMEAGNRAVMQAALGLGAVKAAQDRLDRQIRDFEGTADELNEFELKIRRQNHDYELARRDAYAAEYHLLLEYRQWLEDCIEYEMDLFEEIRDALVEANAAAKKSAMSIAPSVFAGVDDGEDDES